MAQQQRIIRFHGHVQGVGFRFTACRTADLHAVRGYVRNMPDGSVECVVEGDSAAIDAFVADLAQQFDGYIQRQTQQIAPYTDKFHSFGVKY